MATSTETRPKETDAPLKIEARLPPTSATIAPAAEAPVPNPPRPSATQAKVSAPSVLPREVVRGANRPVGAPVRTRERARWKTLRSRPIAWLGAGLGLIVLITGGAAAGAYSRFASSDLIAPNVFIAGVPVGALTQAQALRAVRERFALTQVTLHLGQHTFAVSAAQLGAQLSVEPTVAKAYEVGRDGSMAGNWLRTCAPGEERRLALPIAWNKERLVHSLYALADKVEEKPSDARLVGSDLGLSVVPDQPGRQLNVGEAAHLLQARYYIGLPSLELPLRAVKAKVTARDLQGRDTMLASYTTRFDAGQVGRTQNIRVASRAITYRVVMPGETFSFNACTGKRTATKGYKMAHIFITQPGEEEPEVADGLAGGTCQVSSTLFNAVRKARRSALAGDAPVKIVERNVHSLPVTYVPPGLDATVAWPGKDFKFRNQASYPIYLRTAMSRSHLTVSLWGRLPNT